MSYIWHCLENYSSNKKEIKKWHALCKSNQIYIFVLQNVLFLSRKDVFTKIFCILRFYGLPDMYDSDVIEESQVYGVL